MIKINLLPQKRAKRAAGRAAPISLGGGGEFPREFVIGCAALAGAAAVVFFAIDQPKRSHLRDLRDSTDQLQGEIAAKQKLLVDFPAMKQAVEESQVRTAGHKQA